MVKCPRAVAGAGGAATSWPGMLGGRVGSERQLECIRMLRGGSQVKKEGLEAKGEPGRGSGDAMEEDGQDFTTRTHGAEDATSCVDGAIVHSERSSKSRRRAAQRASPTGRQIKKTPRLEIRGRKLLHGEMANWSRLVRPSLRSYFVKYLQGLVTGVGHQSRSHWAYHPSLVLLHTK